MYEITKEQRDRYNANRRAKKKAETPEEREQRLARRRAYEKEKRVLGGEERRKHDRAQRLAYVHNKKLENPAWDNERYRRSKLAKLRRAAELSKTLKQGEKLCSRCHFTRPEEDFPFVRTGERSTMCSHCFATVMQGFDTTKLSYWKVRAVKLNHSAKSRLVKLGKFVESDFHRISGEELMGLWEAQGHKCAYCKIPLTVLITAYDHKVPLSRGGTHDISNVQLICHNCNVSKFTMTDDEYRRFTQ